LCRGHGLGADAAEKLLALLGLVSTDGRAATSLRAPAEVLDGHLADSLCALELPVVREAATVVDIGSGAGFPGLPLAIALPGAEVTLLESNGRKCAFLEVAIERCAIANCRAVAFRAEEWPQGRGRFDVATARALAPLAVIAEYAAPLLRVGGCVVAWKGRRDGSEESAAERAAAELGLVAHEPLEVHPYPSARARHLYLMSKVAPTPSRFPRRPGMARKRPLGRS
jgi:16S rRNA (guanine527-N7)-methyltransferase